MVEEFSTVLLMALRIRESMLYADIEKYKETGDFEEFKDCLTASLSPAVFECLEIAIEELSGSLKDYHILMSFLDNVKKIAYERVDEISKEFNPIELVEED